MSEVRLIAMRGATRENFVDTWQLCEGTWERAWDAAITQEEGAELEDALLTAIEAAGPTDTDTDETILAKLRAFLTDKASA